MVSITGAAWKLATRSFVTSSKQPGALSALPRLPLTRHASPEIITTRHFSSVDTYYEQKKAAKDLRTQLYHERKKHEEKVKRRRDGKPKNSRKKEFMAWFRPKAKFEQYHNHQARKLGLDWKIEVAVVLERLPVVLPDKPKWQAEYDNLRAYLDQFGREYPVELYGSMEIEELENLTDEAILGMFSNR
jgi:39S mitochondrial ribosomal protein L46